MGLRETTMKKAIAILVAGLFGAGCGGASEPGQEPDWHNAGTVVTACHGIRATVDGVVFEGAGCERAKECAGVTDELLEVWTYDFVPDDISDVSEPFECECLAVRCESGRSAVKVEGECEC